MPQDSQPNERDDFVKYLRQMLFLPYRWGGSDPMEGFDCSGMAVEGFKRIGRLEENRDKNADALFQSMKTQIIQRSAARAGCLAFWFNQENRAVHVATFIDRHSIIHASGGGASTLTIEDAMQKDAFIKIRYFDKFAAYRKDRYNQKYKIVDPFLTTETTGGSQ